MQLPKAGCLKILLLGSNEIAGAWQALLMLIVG